MHRKEHAFAIPPEIWEAALRTVQRGMLSNRTDAIRALVREVVSGLIPPPPRIATQYGEKNNTGTRGKAALDLSVWIDPRTGETHESYQTVKEQNRLIVDICYALAQGRFSVRIVCTATEE
ncbi:hypothetical protein AB0G15_05760 [Streptosporangium sp. NPDC023825]|uniref:hypothetical protein n=1 Tax=Streptosporangium sp. NPDC023825 TaxID=3154909 RepID=UPI00342A6C4A